MTKNLFKYLFSLITYYFCKKKKEGFVVLTFHRVLPPEIKYFREALVVSTEIFELKNVLLNLADKRVTFPNSFGINPFLISSSNLDVANKKVVKTGFDFNNFSKLC